MQLFDFMEPFLQAKGYVVPRFLRHVFLIFTVLTRQALHGCCLSQKL